MTTYKIHEIEGIGPQRAEKLAVANITTTADLLAHCSTPDGRQSVAAKTGLDAGQLTRWTRMADLMRVNGVGSEYSELLQAAGMESVTHLAKANPADLATKLAAANNTRQLVRALPAGSVVESWVRSATTLPPISLS